MIMSWNASKHNIIRCSGVFLTFKIGQRLPLQGGGGGVWITLLFYYYSACVSIGRVVPNNPRSIGAIAGFNFNDGENPVISQTLPNSGTDDIVNLITSSNVQAAGVWTFQVDGDQVRSITLRLELWDKKAFGLSV